MKQGFFKRLAALVAFALFSTFSATPLWAASKQDDLVTKSEATFSAFSKDPQIEWLNKNLRKAKAIVIAPSIVKAGFVLGGSGGHALLIARDKQTGAWAGPVFYTLATVSAGFQAGVEVSEAVMLVMTDKALDRMLNNSFKLGGDIGVTAGPVGAGAESSITADVVSFTRSKGLYGGINIDGSVVKVSDEWNHDYFKKKVTPTDILVRRNARNASAEPLLNAITAAAK